MEKAFLRLEIKVMKLGDFEDVVYGALMIGHIRASSDSNVVHVDSDSRAERFVLEDDVTVDVVHHCLECRWRIGESEIHDRRLKKSVSGFERCLLFISFANAYIVVSPSNVKFCIDVCVTEVADEVRD